MKHALTQHTASEIITRIRFLCQVLRSKKKFLLPKVCSNGSQDSAVSTVVRLWAEVLDFLIWSPAEASNVSFSKGFRPPQGPKYGPAPYVRWDIVGNNDHRAAGSSGNNGHCTDDARGNNGRHAAGSSANNGHQGAGSSGNDWNLYLEAVRLWCRPSNRRSLMSFRGFPQSNQANSNIPSKIRPRPLTFTYCSMQHSLISQPLDAIYSTKRTVP